MMETYLEALLVDVDLQVQHVRGLAGLKVPAGIERRRRTGDVPGKQRPSAGKARHQAHLVLESGRDLTQLILIL